MRRYVSAGVAVANRQQYRGGTPYIYAAGVWNGGESRADLTQSRRREHAPRHKKATSSEERRVGKRVVVEGRSVTRENGRAAHQIGRLHEMHVGIGGRRVTGIVALR